MHKTAPKKKSTLQAAEAKRISCDWCGKPHSITCALHQARADFKLVFDHGIRRNEHEPERPPADGRASGAAGEGASSFTAHLHQAGRNCKFVGLVI